MFPSVIGCVQTVSRHFVIQTPVTIMSNDLKGGMTNLSGVYGTLLPDNNLNYSVQVGNTHGVIHRLAPVVYSSLNYRGAYGNTNVGYSRSGDSSQIYYGMSGGIIAHADGITFGQPLGDTMVLVKGSWR